MHQQFSKKQVKIKSRQMEASGTPSNDFTVLFFLYKMNVGQLIHNQSD